MKQPPRQGLRIGAIEIREEVVVGQIGKTRCIIGHAVEIAGDVVGEMNVAMQALVEGLVA